MSSEINSFKEKVRQAFSLGEKYSWIFYLIILALTIPLRLEWIETQENVLDFIIAITLISITSQIVNKLRNRDNNSKPFIRCLKCNAKIDPTGIWKCKNIIEGKECGWFCDFPK